MPRQFELPGRLGLRCQLAVGMFMFLAFVLLALPPVAMTVAHFVTSEVLIVIGPVMLVIVLAARRVFPVPSIVAIIVIIDVSPEVLVTAIPGSGANEDAA